MIQSYNIQGTAGGGAAEGLEYSFTICGEDIRQEIYGYEIDASDEGVLRLFSQGNQIHIKKEGVFHAGCGGTFCEYMFGIQVPIEDFLRAEVLNRLVLFGAKQGKVIQFANKADRFDPFSEIFTAGHLFCNYYFFVTFAAGSNQNSSLAERQMFILRSLGRIIKHSHAVADYSDVAMQKLSQAMQDCLRIDNGTLFLVRLFDRKIYEFYRMVKLRAMDDPRFLVKAHEFVQVAIQRGIDRFSAERLRLDLAYKIGENRQVVDLYKNELAAASGSVAKMSEVRRLRVLCLRRNIPKELLVSIEQKLPQANLDRYRTEPAYINEARAVLEDHVLHHPATGNENIPAKLPNEAIRVLYRARFRADQEGSKSFEQLLLDYSHRVDNSKNGVCAELFSSVIKQLDSYETLQRHFNALVFVDHTSLDNKTIVKLRNAYKSIASISLDDLTNFIIMPILDNLYATQYGKEKLHLLIEALEVETVDLELVDKAEQMIGQICGEERTYNALNQFIRDNIKIFYLENNTEVERDNIRRRISAQLKHDGKIQDDLSKRVFDRVLQDLHLESIYLNDVLPEAIINGDWKSREEFIRSSTLDQHYIETIEKAYCRRNHLKENYIDLVRQRESVKGKPAVEVER